MTETPADTIRRAASLMRTAIGTPWYRTLADWLESRAIGACDAIAFTDGSLNLSFCRDPEGIEWALKVSRAYLGETA